MSSDTLISSNVIRQLSRLLSFVRKKQEAQPSLTSSELQQSSSLAKAYSTKHLTPIEKKMQRGQAHEQRFAIRRYLTYQARRAASLPFLGLDGDDTDPMARRTASLPEIDLRNALSSSLK